MRVTRQGAGCSRVRPGPWLLFLAIFALIAPASTYALTSATPAPPPAHAPAPPTLPDPTVLQRQLAQLNAQLPATVADDKLAALRTRAAQIQAQAEQLTAARTSDFATANQELAQLKSQHLKRDALRRQTHDLTQQRTLASQQLAQARQVSATAERTFAAVAERQRTAFDARLFQRTASPLEPVFWASLAGALQPDVDRLWLSASQAVDTAWNAPEPQAAIVLGVSMALALALLFPVRRLLERFGRRWTGEDTPGRSFLAPAYGLWMVLVDTALPGVAAGCVLLGARWGGGLSDEADRLGQAVVAGVIWGAAVVALGRVLISANDPQRRLAPLDDASARRIGGYPWIVAAITAAGLVLTRLNNIVGASVSAAVAANCLISLAYVAVAAVLLLALGKERTPLDEAQDPATAAASSGWPLVSLAVSTAMLVAIGALLAGYTTLGALVAGQIFWLGTLAAVTYLLIRFIDAVCSELFAPGGWAARALFRVFSLRPPVIAQLGVLTSASFSVMLLLGVISLALTPFGRTGEALLTQLNRIGQPFHIGSITISPTALAAGMASLGVGMALVHMVQRWLNRRFLPVTDWDSGVRNSVNMGVGYLGVGLAILWALAIAGLGFQQIALVASALSVGIGFGLQQVVQNFVSGLILLVERPVKVGDWVNLGGQEGDIKNIRVRATEIETSDHTTLIVPNSSFITATVQNKTLGHPQGQVQIKLAISMVQDAKRARDLFLETFADNPEVLKQPPPKVFINSVAPGEVNLKCVAAVASPRDAYRIRSDIYFEALERMLEAKIMFPGGGTPSMVVEPGPDLLKILSRAEAAIEAPARNGHASGNGAAATDRRKSPRSGD